jgi:N6-L-threonylcarbamoyladenine synthase
VGVAFARALSYAAQKSLIEVNHIQAHLYASFLTSENSRENPIPQLPAIGLVVSGGHTSLYHLKNINHIRLIGQTRDDAAGEAYDKVARLMNLGYPGGPVIDRMAGNHTKPVRLRFKSANLPDSHDFSFSGIKTAVLYHLQRQTSVSGEDKSEIAAAFQNSVVENLVQKALEACQQKRCRTLLVGGGVAANSALRRRLGEEGKQQNIQIHIPPLALCLDNAAMIAGLGWPLWKNKKNILKNAAFDYNKN